MRSCGSSSVRSQLCSEAACALTSAEFFCLNLPLSAHTAFRNLVETEYSSSSLNCYQPFAPVSELKMRRWLYNVSLEVSLSQNMKGLYLLKLARVCPGLLRSEPRGDQKPCKKDVDAYKRASAFTSFFEMKPRRVARVS